MLHTALKSMAELITFQKVRLSFLSNNRSMVGRVLLPDAQEDQPERIYR